MFDKLFKAAIGTVLLPVDIVSDVAGEIASGGDHRRPSQTGKRLKQISDNVDKALK